jgi:regulator of replication initiation timing
LGDFVKKKELFEQNTVLYNRLQTVSEQLKKYKELYNKNTEEINALREEIDSLRAALAEKEQNSPAEPHLANEEKSSTSNEEKTSEAVNKPIILDVELEDAASYGAQIIGKIVLEGTMVSNSVAEKQSDLSVDIINLILGKTEVCKSKIYDVCHSNMDDAAKKQMLDEIFSECVDYFSSLKNQI